MEKQRRITINVKGSFLSIPEQHQPRFAEAAVEYVITQGDAKKIMEMVIGLKIADDGIFQAIEKSSQDRKRKIKKIKIFNDENKFDHDETSITKVYAIKEKDNFKPESTQMKTTKADDLQLSLL